MSWLQVPMPLLAAYAERLPALQAEASLRHATEIAVGSGTLRSDDAREIGRRWERAARAGERQTLRPSTRAQVLEFAGASGLRVVVDPPLPETGEGKATA